MQSSREHICDIHDLVWVVRVLKFSIASTVSEHERKNGRQQTDD